MRESPLPASTGVAVIGGGPAGLMAAGEAAGAGAEVLLLEGGDRPGRKLLLTGKKRCNLTNCLPLEEFLKAYGPKGRFLRNAYSRFFSEDLATYFTAIGVETGRERGERIYPLRGGAQAVLRAMVRHARSVGAEIRTGRRVTGLEKTSGGMFRVRGESFKIRAHTVVLAPGGASFPWTGSRGDGYPFARRLGHRIVSLRPSLVPVRCAEPFLPRLAGLRLRNVSLTFLGERKKRALFAGEVHFTDFGITGPAVFAASREIGLLTESGALPLRINLKPSLKEKTLEARLQREFEAGGRCALSRTMEKLLPRQLVPVFLEQAGTPAELEAGQVDRRMRRRLAGLLQAFTLTATGTLPLARAMVTSGGVHLKEVNPATMESRIVPGLFFGGEILDLDGTTGGFNLQAAFSTGFLAGRSAAEAVRGK